MLPSVPDTDVKAPMTSTTPPGSIAPAAPSDRDEHVGERERRAGHEPGQHRDARAPSDTSARAAGRDPPTARDAGRADSRPARRRGFPWSSAAGRADRRGTRARAPRASPCRRTRTAATSRGARAPATAPPRPARGSPGRSAGWRAASPSARSSRCCPDRPSTDHVRSPGLHETSRLARARRSCQSELSKCPISTFDACASSRRSASSCTRRTNRFRP